MLTCEFLLNTEIFSVKIVQIRSFFWSVFYHIWTEYGDIRSKYPSISVFGRNMEKYGPEKTPYLHFFHTVFCQHYSYKNLQNKNYKFLQNLEFKIFSSPFFRKFYVDRLRYLV